MERAIAFPKTDSSRIAALPRDAGDEDARALSLRWSARVSLTPRILFVNVFALAMLAGGFFYLDSYRSRIVDGRVTQSIREARLIAEAVVAVPTAQRPDLAVKLARDMGSWIRIYDADAKLIIDTRALGLRNFVLQDPDKQDWSQGAARFLDAGIDTVVGTPRAPLYRERSNGLAWPDVRTVRAAPTVAATVWRAPDRTPVITAASPMPGGSVVMTTFNARDITQTVRVERFRLSIVLFVVALVSVLLSLFLARTIVRPLRRLAWSAVRVRMGRAREVVVPRLPDRRDEIGMLARALSDMSLALRARIDAIEAFAADVTHEMKNPLASLRSAVEGLAMVKDPALQERLLAIVRDDVHRLDRLITDIAEASRLDAQLSRAKFEPVDLGAMIAALIASREARGVERGIRLHFDRRAGESLVALGDGARLERVLENVIANAISFSPDDGRITILARHDEDVVFVAIEDEGPGVPAEAREQVFQRFQSLRPAGEAFGKHSGLGLAIARTIVDAHQGSIVATQRDGGASGARFVIRLPAAAPGA
ncbi:sensor histidine kinase [Sphingomonas sp. PAMC 26605]|uniref:sensor histidine kinase n=1 Tax=Sphingomonas sp. PAMC 26605 TaxID=1112214 RepID=UPI00026CD744|nr:ATP-binding protein [Sphingomonas sp. PAMC 26605]